MPQKTKDEKIKLQSEKDIESTFDSSMFDSSMFDTSIIKNTDKSCKTNARPD